MKNKLRGFRFSGTPARLLLFVPAVLLLGLFAAAFPAAAQDEEDNTPVRVDTLLITVPLTVSDKKGLYVGGLKKENFTVYEDGLVQEISLFQNDEAPMNVAILLDTSYSTKDVLDKIRKAARDFIKVLRPEDKAVVVGFDNQTVFLCELTADPRELSKAIERAAVTRVDGSDMYDAVRQVADKYFAALKGRKAIIALTDGIVTGRATSAQQTLDLLQQNDTFFYPIIFRTDANSGRQQQTKKYATVELLEIMAGETGGHFYEKDSTKLKEAFQSIAEDLKKQYLLGFYPRKPERGNFRQRIGITVDRDELFVNVKKKL
ncbi:MAG: VWA domain-containing protein [Acidobacteria bacterium]|nr:VWA domain-containing protein [Acidobacteriota bacterium]